MPGTESSRERLTFFIVFSRTSSYNITIVKITALHWVKFYRYNYYNCVSMFGASITPGWRSASFSWTGGVLVASVRSAQTYKPQSPGYSGIMMQAGRPIDRSQQVCSPTDTCYRSTIDPPFSAPPADAIVVHQVRGLHDSRQRVWVGSVLRTCLHVCFDMRIANLCRGALNDFFSSLAKKPTYIINPYYFPRNFNSSYPHYTHTYICIIHILPSTHKYPI